MLYSMLKNVRICITLTLGLCRSAATTQAGKNTEILNNKLNMYKFQASLNYIFPLKSAGRQCNENSFAVFSVITEERKLKKNKTKKTTLTVNNRSG